MSKASKMENAAADTENAAADMEIAAADTKDAAADRENAAAVTRSQNRNTASDDAAVPDDNNADDHEEILLPATELLALLNIIEEASGDNELVFNLWEPVVDEIDVADITGQVVPKLRNVG
ncbi:uncharacterized protein LOC120636399 [Pararge aegeria]|uniref:uncharacterized protein LOC120636399 n=1 Tax=Pararge aegeria TaxID=116150 RepID=UPI0019D1E0F5|nr:uncharacterized protein LOC120636399 [Pararge aegeria]